MAEEFSARVAEPDRIILRIGFKMGYLDVVWQVARHQSLHASVLFRRSADTAILQLLACQSVLVFEIQEVMRTVAFSGTNEEIEERLSLKKAAALCNPDAPTSRGQSNYLIVAIALRVIRRKIVNAYSIVVMGQGRITESRVIRDNT